MKIGAKIRLTFVADTDRVFQAGGGAEFQMMELMQHLDRARFDIGLIVFRRAGANFQPPSGLQVHSLGIESLYRPRTVGKLWSLKSILEAEGTDIAHIFFNDAAIAAPVFCRLAGAKVVSSRRDLGFWHTPVKLSALRVSNRFVDRIVANSEAVKGSVIAREHFPASKIQVIFNGHREERFAIPPDHDFRRTHGIGERDPIIGMVASFYVYKRQKDIITALATDPLLRTSAHLVLVGGTPQEAAQLGAFADSLGVGRRVHFTGTLGEVVPVVKCFDVGVLCSETEGLSNAIIEYMGCGKPVVCTSVGGNPEIVTHGEEGFLVETGDIRGLSRAVADILSDDALRARMGQTARASFERRFRTDAMISSYAHLYEQIAAPSKSRGAV